MNDNWYLVLELPFDPVPEENQAVIKQRINEKVQYWSRNSTDPKNGPQYDAWRANAAKIEQDMADAATRRSMADEARKITFGPLDKVLNLASKMRSKPITREQLKNIAKLPNLKTTETAVEKRAHDLGITIAEGKQKPSPEKFKAVFDEHYATQPPKFAAFNGYLADLGPTGATSLYDFLQKEGCLDSGTLPSSVPASVLLAKSEELAKKTYFRPKNPTDTAKRSTAGNCRMTFKDEGSKREYDNYLSYLGKRAQIDECIENIRITTLDDGRCAGSEVDDCILELEKVVKDRDKATELFVAICETRGFPYIISDEESPTLKNRVVCVCGFANDTSGGRKVCERCGRELWHTCPKCSTLSLATVNFCSCGFDFSAIDKTKALCAMAQESLKSFEIEEARGFLREAKSLYPGHKDIAAVETKLATLEKQIGSKVADISRQVTAKKFDTAKRLFLDLQRSFPQYQNPSLYSTIEEQLQLANEALTKAKSSQGEEAVLTLCKKAHEICRDLPGLQELASRYTKLPLDALGMTSAVASGLSASVINNKVALRLTLPDEGETGIIAAYRFDQYPVSATDPLAQCKDFSIAEFKAESILSLEHAQEKRYYISIYLKFAVGDDTFFSQSTCCELNLADKVVLTYSITKKLFSKKITLEIQPNKPVSTLPAINIVYNVGNIPTFVNTSKPLTVIPQQVIQGNLVIELDPPNPLLKNTFIKPFMLNEGSGFQLKIASGSTNKIS